MRTWLSIAGIMLGLAVTGLLLGALGGAVWVGATDDDPAVVASLPSATAGSSSTGSSPVSGNSTATNSNLATAPPIPTAELFEPISIAGNGDRIEPVSALTPGIAVLTIRHDGDGAFKIILERGDGESTATLAKGRGAWEGSRAVLILAGQQPVLVVEADGPWDVTIDRPLPVEDNIVQLPFEQAGSGSRAVFYIDVPQGKHTLTATHSGVGPFVITIMNEAGRGRAKLIDVAGDYDEAVEFEGRFFPTSYLLIDIRANGDWTIKIE